MNEAKFFVKPDLMTEQRKEILCPHCKEPLTCTLFTHVLIQKNDVPLTKNGIDIVDEESKSDTPIMYADEFCMLIGHYGEVEERLGTFFHSIKKITCRNCGELKEYRLYSGDGLTYSLITEDEYKAIQNNDRRKKK